MREDDTIRILKRLPFYEMMKMYRSSGDRTASDYHIWFREYGWTWEEFVKQWVEWNGGQSTYSDFEKSKQ